MMEINFNLHKQLSYGKAVFVSGNLPELGSWTASKALRLQWHQGHHWSASLTIPKEELKNTKKLQYKYLIGNWQQAVQGQIQWQKGTRNRQIDTILLQQKQNLHDEWNMFKLKIHLITKKLIQQPPITHYRYSVVGNCPELGNWKIRKILKIQQNIDCKVIRKLSQKIAKIDLLKFLHNQLVFEIYSTTVTLPLDQEKFSYYFIRQDSKLQIQRHPGRCFTIIDPHRYPHRYAILHFPQSTGVYDEQNFDKPTLSKITPQIYLGSYLKTQNDLKHLRDLGIQAIYSIQTVEDHQDNGISPFYLDLLCKQYGIIFKTIEIQDKNPRDFVQKSMKAVSEIDQLIKEGNTTYVYCSAGKYRSPQMVALYLTLKNGINVTEAVNIIREKHPVARPNEKIIKKAIYHINKNKTNCLNTQTVIQTIKN